MGFLQRAEYSRDYRGDKSEGGGDNEDGGDGNNVATIVTATVVAARSNC